MEFLKALGLSLLTWLGICLAVLMTPIFVLLFAWVGFALAAGAFLFLLLLFTHNPHTLGMSGYMFLLAAPPLVGSGLLGFYAGKLRGLRNRPAAMLR